MFARQSNTGLLLAAAHQHWLVRRPDDDDRTRDCDGLGPAVDRALHTDFDPDVLQIVVVGDPSAIHPDTTPQDLGPIVLLDPADF